MKTRPWLRPGLDDEGYALAGGRDNSDLRNSVHAGMTLVATFHYPRDRLSITELCAFYGVSR